MEDLGYQPHLAVPEDKRRKHNHKKPKLNNWILVQSSRTMNSLCSKNSHLFQVAMLSVHKPHPILVQPAIRVQVWTNYSEEDIDWHTITPSSGVID